MKSVRFIRKDVFNLTIPIFTEQLFVMSMGMINTMMAGNIGKEAVSAIGMVDSINNIFIAFFSALAIGGTVVVAQFIGQKNDKLANESMKQVLYSGILISFGITLITWISRNLLISLLFGSAEGEVIRDTYTYLGITLLTYPLIALNLICNGILRGAGDSKTPMKISIFMNFINVILSFILIYGINIDDGIIKINTPGLGIKGAALGIAFARIIGAITVLLVLLRGTKIIKLTKLTEFKFNKQLLKPIFSIGIPASVESLLFNCGKLITQVYIVDIGTIAIASNAIAVSVSNMLNIPGNALSIAATALVGQYMGRRKIEEAERCLLYMTKLSTLALISVGIIFIPFSKIISSLYTQNLEIINLTTKLLIINGLAMCLWAISFVLPAGLKGAGDAKYTMITSIIGMWIFRITFGYVLGIPLGLGLIGVWIGMYTDWFVRGILYIIRFRKGKWKNIVLIGRNNNISKNN
ncbi:putative efflux protein, MATE family [Clostridium pasteurianum DSM 525 = ATCC 6013]|uniref:Probable multidrug resistance protein NorM n=1 Tax=Clostridium pasteurianum DSM 525 = ATCC 6013 TaxID=1262449 RepID=A0A0H3J845_CLOPA|nr:MATE family efflux transporter [Clostridium pasteurianum]AJA49382.1 putative efflux protein, MATE family [Clostridium pasteurianum DSM 525 = ATCC 6013]AJA53370.1 putative efflux protein, MATE family [Clostridium pasteurianum DSM 525 = ATCC 6013]AOZ76554.1 MATE family efflux transporter [Clostridium pasteurianum DSM 525 = ATCC 6013]AOZ80351.1 MATE family efflux transporter [Clostridium pasteurianum]ELP58502.1 multidrug resistance cation efflux pump [Clostridium pasteurianum DSM 525 = ATCC 60